MQFIAIEVFIYLYLFIFDYRSLLECSVIVDIHKQVCIYRVLCLSFSFRYLTELKLFQSLKNEASWDWLWVSL